MKTVTLTQDMRPWRAGDDIHIEDDLAEKIVAEGAARNPRPFQAMQADERPAPQMTAPADASRDPPQRSRRGAKTYQTK